jgi:phage terminase large subunit
MKPTAESCRKIFYSFQKLYFQTTYNYCKLLQTLMPNDFDNLNKCPDLITNRDPTHKQRISRGKVSFLLSIGHNVCTLKKTKKNHMIRMLETVVLGISRCDTNLNLQDNQQSDLQQKVASPGTS